MLNNIGVIGAGQMGSGIAHVCALAEHDVVIVDIDAAALEKSLSRIDGNMDRQIKRTLIAEEDKAAALARITTATGLDAAGSRGQCTCSAHAVHTQCTRSAHAVHTQCTRSAHAVHV